MVSVVSIRLNAKGKLYFFDPCGLNIEKGDFVIVETSKCLEYGECVVPEHEVSEEQIVSPLRPVIRIATKEDTARVAYNREKNGEIFNICREKIEEMDLPMKLVSAEYGFDGSIIHFSYTADGRVDFRELVTELKSLFKTRIRLQQIYVRDEAKLLGGLGICGKQFCCSQFLSEFHHVSVKMAKTQGLSLNLAKISGTCGRLMCCLKYEEETYEDLNAKAPKVDSFVETPGGKGSIVSVNLLRGSAKVRLEEGNDTTLKTFSFEELAVLGGKTRRAEYQAAKAEGRLAEAGFKPSQPVIPEPSQPPQKQPFREQRGDSRVQQAASSPRPEPVKKARNGNSPRPERKAPENRVNAPSEDFPENQKNPKPVKNRYYRRKKRGE